MRSWQLVTSSGSPRSGDEMEALGTFVELETQLELFLEARRMTERGSVWMLRHRRPPLDIATAVAEFRPG